MINTAKSRSGTVLSLRALLGEDFDLFLQQYIEKPITQWAEDGKIDAVTLRRLNKALGKGGKDLFDIPAEQLAYATRHTIEDGELLRVKLPITSTLAIDNFVKIFSSYDKFRKAVDIQERIFSHVNGTDLESLVVAPIFKNRFRNMVSYPFVNASSLMDRLPEMDGDEKEAELLNVIEDYQRLSVELTEHVEIFDDIQDKSVLEPLWTPDESYEMFFFGRLGHSDGKGAELRALISKYMNPGHEGKQYVIHGDLNPGNVIKKNGSYAIIDQEDGCTGFLEFDYCKLLTKAGLSDDAEESIVRKAAESLAKVEGRETDAEEIEASEKRYSLNRINQDLFTAVRYLKRARENNKSKTMKGMALVSYNLALRKIDRAVERGFVGADFKEGLEAFIAENHEEDLYDLGDKFEEYKEMFNPHTKASQENVVSAPSLDLMLAGRPDQDEIKAELAKLRKNLRKRKKNWPKIAAWALTGVIAIGSIVGINLYEKFTQTMKERAAQSDSNAMYKNLMLIEREQATASTDTLFLQNDIRYLSEQFGGDKGTVYCWLLNPVATYEAMQETGSQSYDALKEYFISGKIQGPNPRAQVDSLLSKGEAYDNWMLIHDNKYPPMRYDEALDMAKEAYKAKKQSELHLKIKEIHTR